MMQTILLATIALGVWNVFILLKNSHAEIIKGLEAINNKLADK